MEAFTSVFLGILTIVAAIGALVLVGILAIRLARGEYKWELPQVMRAPDVKDRGGRIITVLVLWVIANVVLSWMVPDWWRWWFDRPDLFFHGSQIAIITLLLIQVVFKTERNKPAINTLTVIILVFAVVGFAQQIAQTVSEVPVAAKEKVATGRTQRVNLGFGLYPLSLEPGKSSPRLCIPDGSETSFTRADEETMGFTYYLNPPGNLSKVIQVRRPPGVEDIRLPDFKCVRIAAQTKISLAIDVKVKLDRT